MAKTNSFGFRSKSQDKRLVRRPILRKINQYAEVLVILDETDEKIKKQVETIFSQAHFTYLIPRKEKEIKEETVAVTYHKSDFNLTGSLKSDKLKKLVSTHFDLVVDLSAENKLNMMLLDRLNQSFMIGKRGNDKSHLYDLMLEDTLSNSEIIEQIHYQLTRLSQHGTE